MQATLDARALKPFTKALTCVAKYGDEMLLHCKPDSLALTAINQAKSAFCSCKFSRHFFQKYTVQENNSQSRTAGPSRSHIRMNSEEVLRCQLQTKALLAVLRHRNNERTVERCEISLVEGSCPESEARRDEDAFESRLVIRLHCKHGITKTHRLILNTPTSSEAPIIQDSEYDSHVIIQPQSIKDIFEHFPSAKGPKSDPELLWRFDADEVSVKSLERGIDPKGKSQLASEMFVPTDDFDSYELCFAPVTIGFFLREFNATINLLQSLSLPLSLKFTIPAEPIHITAESDDDSMQLLFVIATNVTRAEDDDPAIKDLRAGTHRPGTGSAKKRAHGGDTNGRSNSARKVVRRVDSSATQQSRVSGTTSTSRQPTASVSNTNSGRVDKDDLPVDFQQSQDEQPLFLPSHSQLSAAEMTALSQSAAALGMENMTADEFAAMLDDEGEEVEMGVEHHAEAKRPSANIGESTATTLKEELECDELDDEEMLNDSEMGPTQAEGLSSSDKAFRPLFED